MMSRNIKRMLRAGAVLSCFAAIGCSSALVYAQPSSKELEEKTSGLQNELHHLNGELDSLGRDLESLSRKIADTKQSMAKTQKRMDEAQKKGEKQYEDMKLRIKYMYETGDTSFLELLFSAENMSDFLNRTDFIKNVSEYDRNMLRELEDTQKQIKKEGDTLKEQEKVLVASESQLEEKRRLLESKISSTSADLSKYSEQLKNAKEAEALLAARQRLEAEKAAAASRPPGPSSGGQAFLPSQDASSDGKKSLGKFKITHYCPCYYCSGGWGNMTSSGTIPTVGRTIAVDPSVISYGTRVIINGHVFIAEDSGGMVNGKTIDVFVADHETALASGVYYAEVFLAD